MDENYGVKCLPQIIEYLGSVFWFAEDSRAFNLCVHGVCTCVCTRVCRCDVLLHHSPSFTEPRVELAAASHRDPLSSVPHSAGATGMCSYAYLLCVCLMCVHMHMYLWM